MALVGSSLEIPGGSQLVLLFGAVSDLWPAYRLPATPNHEPAQPSLRVAQIVPHHMH